MIENLTFVIYAIESGFYSSISKLYRNKHKDYNFDPELLETFK